MGEKIQDLIAVSTENVKKRILSVKFIANFFSVCFVSFFWQINCTQNTSIWSEYNCADANQKTITVHFLKSEKASTLIND